MPETTTTRAEQAEAREGKYLDAARKIFPGMVPEKEPDADADGDDDGPDKDGDES